MNQNAESPTERDRTCNCPVRRVFHFTHVHSLQLATPYKIQTAASVILAALFLTQPRPNLHPQLRQS